MSNKTIRLTVIASPDFASGLPSSVYVDPENIAVAVRGLGSYQNEQALGTYHPRVECTLVLVKDVGAPYLLCVTESPEEVAVMREKSLNNSLEH